MRTGAFLLTALIGVLGSPAIAHANWELTSDGQPLITNLTGKPGQAFVCPPDGAACRPVAWNTVSFYFAAPSYAPGETPPGTTFELSTATSERSPPWQGKLTAVQPPAIVGRPFASGIVKAAPGRWTGGWGDERGSSSILACVTAEGRGCVSLPASSGCEIPCVEPKGSAGPATSLGAIPARMAGRFLLATESRRARDQRGWPIAVTAPWSLDRVFNLERRAHHSVSAPVGPIRPASTVTLRRRALRADGRISVGRVACAVRCRVIVKVTGGGERAYTKTFRVTGAHAITVPYRSGNLRVRVGVDGTLLQTGRVIAR